MLIIMSIEIYFEFLNDDIAQYRKDYFYTLEYAEILSFFFDFVDHQSQNWT